MEEQNPSLAEVLFAIRELRTVLSARPQKSGVPRGYVRGAGAAAEYLGIDRATFRSWRDDPELKGATLLRPRIIRGDTYYSLANLDAFMKPEQNAYRAEIEPGYIGSKEFKAA